MNEMRAQRFRTPGSAASNGMGAPALHGVSANPPVLAPPNRAVWVCLDMSSEQTALRDSAIRARAPDLVKALRTLNVVISLDWAIDLLGAYSSEALPRALALTARYVAGRTRKMRSRFCGPHGWGSTPGWLQQLLQT